MSHYKFEMSSYKAIILAVFLSLLIYGCSSDNDHHNNTANNDLADTDATADTPENGSNPEDESTPEDGSAPEEGSNPEDESTPEEEASPEQETDQEEKFVADHTVAKESVLRQIPVWAINAAKDNLHIMYCGTSHSSQVRDGMYHLQSYKEGDDSLFAVTFDGDPVEGSLDIDYRPTSPVNVYSARDLSNDSIDQHGHTDYYYTTIEYLDHPEHADVNVVMWSWCSISGHDVQRYIDNFDDLIEMYSAGGSKGRTAENAVTFVWMSGYARGSDGIDPDAAHSPYVNHQAIVDHCNTYGDFCLDYWSHDTHDYETDEFYPYAQGNSPEHLLDWMNSNPDDWYACNPAHAADYDLLGNRRAYAAWWIWARIAGWDGTLE